MNTPPNLEFKIEASHLGPIFSVKGELSKNAQNLIFARNGTGKSFLSRAFRYLDLYKQGKDVSEAALYLVSEESADGKGSFSFLRGTDALGTLQLEKTVNKVAANVDDDTIFHVFSEEFVHEELRDREYKIDGEIENQIAVDSVNIQLKDKQEEFNEAQNAKKAAGSELQEEFNNAKKENLVKKAEINKGLSKYKNLDLKSLLELFLEKPNAPEPSFANILADLDKLKAIPANSDSLGTVNAVESEIDLNALERSLQKVTSPSSVSDEIKKKIDASHSFYETGTQIVQEEHRITCPFCEQGITSPDPKAVIDAYVSYFADEEEKHKRELKEYLSKLDQKEASLQKTKEQLAQQKQLFDILKHYVPSKKDVEVADGETALKDASSTISEIKAALEQKTKALDSVHSLPANKFTIYIDMLNEIIYNNNSNVTRLTNAIKEKDSERLTLQRKACDVFGQEFILNSWSKIEDLKNLNEATQTKNRELENLKNKSPSSNARNRVAETFTLLLKVFFADKYVFDSKNFILKRRDKEMKRGPHRTLSDGEKAVIAFCYFVACVHRKVKSDSDYRKLFLIFDDPVSSMSYDFVFSIAQTLKNLSISDQGEVSINPSKITADKNKSRRPNLLVLTHSSYFFNISLTNRVIRNDAMFSLYRDGNAHKLVHLHRYVTPFEQQLKHVYHVANGNASDHSTGNAIRQVLEAIGRFCRPDKSDSLQNFIAFLAACEDKDFQIESVLINSLSHGTYYDETPTPEDLKLACEATITVVEHFAFGQLELIKNAK